MWIKTEDNILLNMDKVAYVRIDDTTEVIHETGEIVITGAQVVAYFGVDTIGEDLTITIASFINDDLKKANAEAECLRDYIVRSLYDSDIKVMEIDDYK